MKQGIVRVGITEFSSDIPFMARQNECDKSKAQLSAIN
jgi:hypothetical protein